MGRGLTTLAAFMAAAALLTGCGNDRDRRLAEQLAATIDATIAPAGLRAEELTPADLDAIASDVPGAQRAEITAAGYHVGGWCVTLAATASVEAC